MQQVLVGSIVAHTGRKVIVVLIIAPDGAAEVVTAIDDIHDPGEAFLVTATAVGLTADIGLGMTQDVGFAGTGKCVVDTAVA